MAAPQENHVSYTLYSGRYLAFPNRKDETEYLPGATGVYYGINSFTGYSSLAYKGWGQIFGCESVETPFCTIYAGTLLRRGQQTGALYIDLFKIDTVVAQKGIPAVIAMAALPHWTRRDMPNTIHFGRAADARLPGTASWHSRALSLDGPAQLEPDGEELTVSNSSASAGLVAFARPYYPGFSASLDGRELNVHPVENLVVGVDVPPHASGTLRLTFLPPFLIPSVALAALALLLWVMAAFLEKRGRLRGL